MNIFDIKVPSIGEGTRYVKVTRILVSVGQLVRVDQPLVEIETEKATMEMPSSTNGIVVALTCEVGQRLYIGETLLKLEAGAAVSVQIRRGERISGTSNVETCDLPEAQEIFARNIQASSEIVVSASLDRTINWEKLSSIKKALRANGEAASSLGILTWAVSRCMKDFEKFKWRITEDNKVLKRDDCVIGIAVSGENDSLIVPALAVDGLFSAVQASERVAKLISSGKSLTEKNHSLAISDMSCFETIRAVPIVVYPSVATLVVGTPYWGVVKPDCWIKQANISLAFDHRIINGVYAARFLSSVEKEICLLAKQLDKKTKGSVANGNHLARIPA